MENGKRRRYFLIKRSEMTVVILYSLGMSIVLFFLLARAVRFLNVMGWNYCMLDCLHEMEDAQNFGIFYFLITVSLIVGKQRSLHEPAFVVCYSSTKVIWKQMFGNLLKWSAVFSGIYCGLVCLFSALSSYEANNWHVKYSMFHNVTGTLYEGSTVLVITAFIVFAFIKTVIGAAILSLLEYGVGGVMIGYVIILIPVAVEWFGSEFVLFFNLFSISQDKFIDPRKIFILIGIGALAVFGIYLAGCKIWREKEFYG